MAILLLQQYLKSACMEPNRLVLPRILMSKKHTPWQNDHGVWCCFI